MPMSVRRDCPVCVGGIGLARRAVATAGQPGITVTLVCQSCGHEWDTQHDPSAPHTPPDTNGRA